MLHINIQHRMKDSRLLLAESKLVFGELNSQKAFGASGKNFNFIPNTELYASIPKATVNT